MKSLLLLLSWYVVCWAWLLDLPLIYLMTHELSFRSSKELTLCCNLRQNHTIFTDISPLLVSLRNNLSVVFFVMKTIFIKLLEISRKLSITGSDFSNFVCATLHRSAQYVAYVGLYRLLMYLYSKKKSFDLKL